MDQRLAIAQRQGKAIAITTLIMAILGTKNAIGLSVTSNDPTFMIGCLVLWLEAAILFVGINQKHPTCMAVIKWFNIVLCFLIAANIVIIWTSDLEQDIKIILTVCHIMALLHSICLLIVANRLAKLYEDVPEDRQEITANNGGIVHGDQVATPPAKQGSAPAGMVLSKDFLLQV